MTTMQTQHEQHGPREHHVVLGAGPLGFATARELVERGVGVSLVSRRAITVTDSRIRNVICDILDPVALSAVLTGATVVYQCAQPPYTRWREEFEPLQRAVLLGARQTGARMVIADNLYAYGLVAGVITEDSPIRPISTKGAVRARMAEEALSQHASGAQSVTIVRSSDFFGPGVFGSALGDRVWMPLVRGKPASVAGNPDLLHTYTYLRDFARALCTFGVSARGAGEVWHAPSDVTTSTRQLLQHAAACVPGPVRVRGMGRGMLRLAGLFVPEARETVEMMYEFEQPFVVSSEKFTRAFGIAATPAAAAVKETVRWFQQHGV